MTIWGQFIHPISRVARRKRAKQLLKILPDFNDASVLDVGGSRHYWEKMEGLLEPRALRIINIGDNGQSVSMSGNAEKIPIELYDGVSLPFPDEYFDIIMCNSVIEHVEPHLRRGLVEEIRRVGRAFVIQTPAFSFPIEPHFVAPFLHWLPRNIGREASRFSLYAFLTKASKSQIYEYFDEIHLLKRKEIVSYAPQAFLVLERMFGMTKSFTIIERKGARE